MLTDAEWKELNSLREMQKNRNRWLNQHEHDRIAELVKKAYLLPMKVHPNLPVMKLNKKDLKFKINKIDEDYLEFLTDEGDIAGYMIKVANNASVYRFLNSFLKPAYLEGAKYFTTTDGVSFEPF